MRGADSPAPAPTVIRAVSPPPAGTLHNSAVSPWWEETNAIREPSGDHRGVSAATRGRIDRIRSRLRFDSSVLVEPVIFSSSFRGVPCRLANSSGRSGISIACRACFASAAGYEQIVAWCRTPILQCADQEDWLTSTGWRTLTLDCPNTTGTLSAPFSTCRAPIGERIA